MTLKEIRTQFVNLSGHVELVSDLSDYDNVGADYYIREGQRMLDRKLTEPMGLTWVDVSCPEGSWLIPLTDIRVVKEVWASEDSKLTELCLLREDEFMHKYAYCEPYDDVATGLPAYCAITAMRRFEPDSDYEGVLGLLFLPRAQANTTLRIHCYTLSASLIDGDDDAVSWWTLNHPDTLIQAALYILEKRFRNSTGMRDAMESIDMDIRAIDMDVVEQEINSHSSQIRPSW